jgi:superkiller protein 3
MTREKLFLKEKDITENIPSNVAYYLDIGRKSYNNFVIHKFECDLDTAISSYEKALEIDPFNAEAHYKIASLLWEKDQIDIETAIGYCKKAIDLAPQDVDARMHLGYFYKARGKLEEAIEVFQDAIKLNFIQSGKARIALGLSLIQNAKVKSNKIHLVAKGLFQFSAGLILLLSDNKSLKLIKRSLREEFKNLKFKLYGKFYEIFENTERASFVYEKAIKESSSKELFYEEMGNLHKKNQNYLIAADYYRKAINIEPSNRNLYYKLIGVLDDEIDTKEIINCYKILIDLDPENEQLTYNLGHVYLEDRNYFGAISCFRRAIQNDPENPYYHNSLAYALVQVDDFEGAINEYQQAIAHKNDNIWASIVCQALAAIYYQAKRNHDAAIMTYQMALNFDSESSETLTALAEIYYDKGNYDSSIGCYKKAIQIDNENPQAHCNLGFVYWENNQITEAIKHYQLAIALYPQYDIAYNNLGVAYLDGQNMAALALKVFEIAIKHNPNYALAYYNKGRALEAMGKKSGAADYYQMALDINTFTNEIEPDEIATRLEKLFKVE